jgi:hypothetical protein
MEILSVDGKIGPKSVVINTSSISYFPSIV